MLNFLFLIATILFFGCTTPTKKTVRADGLLEYRIYCYADGWAGGGCETEAAEICPEGYSVVSDYGSHNSYGARTRNLVVVCGDIAEQTNPFKRFFKPQPGLEKAEVEPFDGQAELLTASLAETPKAFLKIARGNFKLAGSSCFTQYDAKGGVDPSFALRIPDGISNISLVLVVSGITDSRTETKIVSRPTMSMNTATLTGVGSWPVQADGFTFGQQNVPVQETVINKDYCAYYFFKGLRPVFGVFPRELNDKEVAATQSHKGVAVWAIINDSPAYHADLMEGDIITHFMGKAITPANFSEMLHKLAGKVVQVQYLRKYQSHTKSIKFNIEE